MAWSAPPTWATGQVLAFTDMNTYVRDNTQHLYDIIHGVVNEALTILGDTTFRDDGALTVTVQRNSTDAIGADLNFRKSRNTNASPQVVGSSDALGAIRFYGHDGTGYIEAANITGGMDGTPGTNDMPGLINFWTTADGASTGTLRMRINAAGQVLISDSIPALAFINDTDTGIVRNSANNMGFYAGGVSVAAIQLNGSTPWFNVLKDLTINQQNANGTGSGAGAIGIGDATTVPSTNPTAGGVLYSQAGALKWRGSSGTVTTIAAA